jgi:putative addiction module component (TIGR02574 family)
MDLRTVVDQVGSWPVEDRLRLIEEVWNTIPESPPATMLSEAQRQDLQHRLDANQDDPKAGSPWEVVEARLRGKPE